MSDDDRPKSFEETLRAIAAEVTTSFERLSQTDLGQLEKLARANGLDPDRARDLADGASKWLRSQLDGDAGSGAFGGFGGFGTPGPASSDPRGPMGDVTADDITNAPVADGVPSPLDVPTAEQGQALAALDSGRWTVEPGTVTLATQTGKGPQPRNAHAIGLALHVRDWVDQDGDLTSAGANALERWLERADQD